MKSIKIGSRGSKLALWQSNQVASQLRSEFPDLTVEIKIIHTRGDKILDTPLANIGGKGLFVKEIEDQLLQGEIDIAVHSLKDVPMKLPESLFLSAFLQREDPRDVMILNKNQGFDQTADNWLKVLPQGTRVGTSSLRRQCQLLKIRKDLEILPLRGNVDTRINKVKAGEVDAAILAAAGLKRLGRQEDIDYFLPPEQFIPAIGQGIIAVETRLGEQPLTQVVGILDHFETRLAARAERKVLAELEGGCQVPMAAHAKIEEVNTMRITGMVGRRNGTEMVISEAEGPADQPEKVAGQLLDDLFTQGARKILRLEMENE